MCQVGEAKGHNVHLEQSFIDDGISYAQKVHADKGMKARFGHPSMSNETLGSEMGRFKNFRVEGDRMLADLHLFESANLSPTHPGMKDWMLAQAKEDPEAIMCSIVFSADHYYQRTEKGEKYKLKRAYSDKDGLVWVSDDQSFKYNPDSKVYVALKELMFCDIVDQGAATDKLLSEQFNSDKFSVIATQFFNDHPKIDSFLQENPDKIFEFLNQRFNITEKADRSFVDKLKSLFNFNQSNPNSYFMAKIQLAKLAELAVKLGENEASAEDYAAVQQELAAQGVDVAVIGMAEHNTNVSRATRLASSHQEAVLVLAPETPEKEVAQVNLSELIKKALKSKDDEIAALKVKLGESETPPNAPAKEKQEFGDDEEKGKEYLSSVDAELAALTEKFK